MAGVNGRQAVATSPNSSEEVDSNLATPATKVSNLTPSDTSGTLKAGTPGIVRSKVPPAFILTQSPQSHSQNSDLNQDSTYCHQDPFVSGPILSATTQSSTDASKLSPIASSFTPQTALTPISVASAPLSGQPPENVSKLVGFAPSNGLYLYPGVHNSNAEQRSAAPSKILSTTGHEFSDQRFLSFACTAFRPGVFSTDNGTSRCLAVGQIAPDCSAAALEIFLSSSNFGSIKKVVYTDLVMANTVYVQFGDMRDVVKAAEAIERSPWGWTSQFLDPPVFAAKTQSRGASPSPVSKYEAQVIIMVSFPSNQQNPKDRSEIVNLVIGDLSRSGDIMALEQIQSVEQGQNVYRAEFYSSDAIDRLIMNYVWVENEHYVLKVHRHEPDLQLNSRRNRGGPLIIGEDDTGLENALQKMTISSNRPSTQLKVQSSGPLPPSLESTPTSRSLTMRKDLGGHHIPSPLTYSFNSYDGSDSQTSPFWSPTYNDGSAYRIASSIWSPVSPGAIGQERGAMLSPSFSSAYQKPLGNGAFDMNQHQRSLYKGGRRHNDHSIGNHNVVDISRIRIGLDVRTTIMLRNIPNKMTSAVLKSILDETSFGKYDFTYLRIDFANNCNVGYAFINFEDPIHIMDFVAIRAGRRWNCYNSDKVAEISYATIQGRDCLIQKFRNSSVMLEQPSSRPKIWSTSGPSVGQEEPFPGPDNPSKMRRSVENAEHVGLFAPRAGQNFRDEQRRRRSQYDRGTRLAEIEESYDTTTYPYRENLNPINARILPGGNFLPELGQMYYSHRAGLL